jgi:hypothetical protein
MIRTGIPIDKITNDFLFNRLFSDTETIVVAVSIVELLLKDVEVKQNFLLVQKYQKKIAKRSNIKVAFYKNHPFNFFTLDLNSQNKFSRKIPNLV